MSTFVFSSKQHTHSHQTVGAECNIHPEPSLPLRSYYSQLRFQTVFSESLSRVRLRMRVTSRPLSVQRRLDVAAYSRRHGKSKNCNHPLQFSNGAKWYSEARMSSPLRPRVNSDPLGEGFTNVDGIIGHFEFRPPTKTGLQLKPGGQFVIVEARTFNTSVLHPWLSIHRTWVGICRCFGKKNDQAMD
jgi:hypothetical protein